MQTLLDALMNFSGPMPYVVVFLILLLCGFGLPLPEDIVLFAAGMMSYYGLADVWVMIGVCFAGVMLGDATIFTAGAFFGRKIRKTYLFKKILPLKRQRIVRRKLHEQGPKVIFSARFMPGLRTPIFFTSGTMHLPFHTFAFYDGLAALISVPTIVYVVFRFGYEVDQVVKIIKKVQFGIIGTVLLFFIFFGLKIYWAWKQEKALEAAADSTDSKQP